ncbi:MAG TPA: L,D-transpeptidase family protein [Bellilinea sp.]|nr:L,D-transpeptidase family protein [Bellilinea sp.]
MDGLLSSFLRSLSRREFLKLSGSAMLGLFTLPFSNQSLRPNRLNRTQEYTLPYGRVTAAKIDGFARPSYGADLKQSYWEDLVLPITGVALGDEESGHNRVWYELNNESFVHSGDVQPVDIQPNPILDAIAPGGQLAEVTVPFTDAVWRLRQQEFLAYRLYYGTTHWVYGRVEDADGKVWYRIDDDKWKISYYVNATHLRIVTADEITPLSPDVPQEEKRLEIRLPEQVVIAYEYNQPVWMARTATGARFRDGDYRTPPGAYITNRKRPSRHMAAGDGADANSYDLPGVPWVCYLMENGISFHGTFWHNNFGRPRSHGCVNLSPQHAQWVYRWTNPVVSLTTMTAIEKNGTMVKVIDTPMAD